MALILSIDTATSNCSVALHRNGELLSVHELNAMNIHATQLFVFIRQLMEEQALSYSQLQAVAVSKGPGSYTGLRIGVSAAKGLCYALNIPLLSVNTLLGLCITARAQVTHEDALLIPMLDARRMEVYNAVYSMELTELVATRALILDEHSFEEYKDKPCYFFGDGMPKFKAIMPPDPNRHYLDTILSSATALGLTALQAFQNKQFEDVAYFEPYYLKEFVSQHLFHTK